MGLSPFEHKSSACTAFTVLHYPHPTSGSLAATSRGPHLILGRSRAATLAVRYTVLTCRALPPGPTLASVPVEAGTHHSFEFLASTPAPHHHQYTGSHTHTIRAHRHRHRHRHTHTYTDPPLVPLNPLSSFDGPTHTNAPHGHTHTHA